VIEQDHIAGRHNSEATFPLPGNAHRTKSDRMRDWPRRTVQNTEGSPLLAAAACVRGWLDILWTVAEFAERVPRLLEGLDAWLTERHGRKWWGDFDLEDRDG